MRNSFDVRALGSWQLTVMLAVIEFLLLLFAAAGPQYGDSAIGGAMQVGLAVVLFAIQLLVVTPIMVVRAIKSGHDFGTAADFWLFGPLVGGPAGLLLVFVVNAAST